MTYFVVPFQLENDDVCFALSLSLSNSWVDMPLNSTHYPELQPFSRFSYFFLFSYFLMLGVNKILVDFNNFKKYDKILVIVSKRKPTRPLTTMI
jgi:hypothetical protein